jgi:hypothetical protein
MRDPSIMINKVHGPEQEVFYSNSLIHGFVRLGQLSGLSEAPAPATAFSGE